MCDQREAALRENVGETKPDTHSLDHSERHLTILTDYRNPNGEPLALVLCRFDMRTHAVAVLIGSHATNLRHVSDGAPQLSHSRQDGKDLRTAKRSKSNTNPITAS